MRNRSPSQGAVPSSAAVLGAAVVLTLSFGLYRVREEGALIRAVADVVEQAQYPR